MEKRLGGGAKGAVPKKGAHSNTPNQVFALNVGGQEFKTLHSTLFRLPNSRLYEIALRHQQLAGSGGDLRAPDDRVAAAGDGGEAECKKERGGKAPLERDDQELFFDRDPEVHCTTKLIVFVGSTLCDSHAPSSFQVFRHVLDYYRTGELHLPSSLCAPFIRKELIFWGLPEDFIEPCCLGPYIKYEEERKTKQLLFRDCFEELEPMREQVRVSRGWRRLRYSMWLFLEFPTSSHVAKVCYWSAASPVLVLAVCVTCVHCRTRSSGQ